MEKIINNILKELKKKGATDVILGLNKSFSNQVKFSNNQISVTQTWNSLDLDIFIAIKNRLAVTSLKDFDKKTIDNAIKNLIKIAKLSPENKDFLGISKGPFRYKKIKDIYDKKIDKIDGSKITESVIKEALDCGVKRTGGILENSCSETEIITSSKVYAKDKGSSIHLSVRALTDKESSGHLTLTSRKLNKFDYIQTARKAAEIAIDSKNPSECKPGKYDVIFSPLAFANLISLVGEATSIFSVESGLSFLKNKLEKKVGSKNVNLYDNPLVPNGIGSVAFDAEGTPTKNNILIKEGILKTYLHNTSTAKKYKTRNTANAGLIAPEPHNLILEKADWSRDEMIKEIKNGVLITNLWYTRFSNYATGEFSTIPRDGTFLINNGKIVSSIRGIRVSDSLPNLLGNLYAVGNKPEQITSWETSVPTTTPEVLIKNVNITKPVE